MAIKVFNHTTLNKRAEAKYNSFEELKKRAVEAANLPPPKPAFRASVSSNENPSTINNGTIRPKYIQDSSVVYKKSGYVKDLLGEGN